MLLIAFTVLPAPTGPTLKMFGPSARSTGRARSQHLRVAADHHGQRGRLRAGHAAAHGRLQEVHAALLGARLDLARRGRQHAAEVDQDGARFRPLDEAARVEIERLHIGRRRQAGHHDLRRSSTS